jgi:UDP-N-acetylglucosamine 2-epimerase (non-hydrolysing)
MTRISGGGLAESSGQAANALPAALVVFGTRPEAIKLAPVIAALKARGGLRIIGCNTGQHRDLVEPVCRFFNTPVDYDLRIGRPAQDLSYVAGAVIARLGRLIAKEKPAVCIVQGDTTTAFAAALSSFYGRVPVAHVEAGLRTGNLNCPWPEEANRVLVSRISSVHFAPTAAAVLHLLKEDVAPETILLTGNTVVDAALWAKRLMRGRVWQSLAARFSFLNAQAPVILFTMHRRESFGPPLQRVFRALQQFCVTHNVQVVFPVHPNPQVAGPAREILGCQPNIHICDPLSYGELIFLMRRCRFLITDSGGLVEEASAFRKPVLVLRETTERVEAVEAGSAILCGYNTARMASLAEGLLQDGALFSCMTAAPSPFGDGRASERIARHLSQRFGAESLRPIRTTALGRAI